MSSVSDTVYVLRASRIFRFTLTSRCAMVAVGTSNARARECREGGGRQRVHCGRDGLLCRVLGHIEVADDTNQNSNDASPIGAIQCMDGPDGIRWHITLLLACVEAPSVGPW